jgi:hypothetical protein
MKIEYVRTDVFKYDLYTTAVRRATRRKMSPSTKKDFFLFRRKPTQ